MTSSTPLVLASANPGPRTEAGKQRSSANSFKHGLYSSRLAFTSAAAEHEYAALLSELRREYSPVLPSECMLVQQLAALQFRYQRVQASYADALRQAVAEETQNPKLPPAFGAITPTQLETRVFARLYETSAPFRLFLHELDRLPNRIFRLIDRLLQLRRARPTIPEWNDTDRNPESEETAQIEGTNPPISTSPITEKTFLKKWAQTPRDFRQTLLSGSEDPAVNDWFACHALDRPTFNRWVRAHTLGA
jgi:hypothetical protein